MTKHMKEYLVYYLTKEYGTTIWVKATDKFRARTLAKRKGRRGIKIYKNYRDIENAYNDSRIDKWHYEWLTNIFSIYKEGYQKLPYTT